MAARSAPLDRKAQILSAAIDRLHAVGFEGFRLGDVAKDVGITNATLIHHYPSKVALIRAVVESFTRRFEAVAEAVHSAGTPRARLARHMRSSVELMRTSPEMFVVLNEIMIRAGRDPDISQLVSVPLGAWRDHMLALLLTPGDADDAGARDAAQQIAAACMAQLLGMGLLLNSTHLAGSSFDASGGDAQFRGIEALTHLARDVR